MECLIGFILDFKSMINLPKYIKMKISNYSLYWMINNKSFVSNFMRIKIYL